jgi:hypothetical protein
MSKRNKLMLFAVAAVLASSAQAFADTFYIIREGQGPCKVVEGHPPGTVTIIGGTKTYTTREAAEKDMALACKTG